MTKLIDDLQTDRKKFIDDPGKMRELKALNELLKNHIRAQKNQPGQFKDDEYRLNKVTGKLQRMRKGKAITGR